MCNLYTVRKSAAEVAAFFGVNAPSQFNTPEETLPGYPRLVAREAEGARAPVRIKRAWTATEHILSKGDRVKR